MAARRDGPVCGHPMAFYELVRPRDDLFPVCCRPPHEGSRHLSKAAVDRERERSRANRHKYDKQGHKRLAA